MPVRAAKAIITEKRKAILLGFVNSQSVSVSLVQRNKIILLAVKGHYNETIENVAGIQHNAVRKWSLRWRDNWHHLIEIECTEERSELDREIQKPFLIRKKWLATTNQVRATSAVSDAASESAKAESRSLNGQETSCVTS